MLRTHFLSSVKELSFEYKIETFDFGENASETLISFLNLEYERKLIDGIYFHWVANSRSSRFSVNSLYWMLTTAKCHLGRK